MGVVIKRGVCREKSTQRTIGGANRLESRGFAPGVIRNRIADMMRGLHGVGFTLPLGEIRQEGIVAGFESSPPHGGFRVFRLAVRLDADGRKELSHVFLEQ